jgi:hypothetical protein
MPDDLRQAFAIGPSPTIEERTIDISTTGRRSGEPRRIEFSYRFEESTYLSGVPGRRRRDWLANQATEPQFTVHLEHGHLPPAPAEAPLPVPPTRSSADIVEVPEDLAATVRLRATALLTSQPAPGCPASGRSRQEGRRQDGNRLPATGGRPRLDR